MTQFWKTQNLPRNIPRNFFKSLKLDSKLFKMVQIYFSISLKIFGYMIKLIGHNLENTEFRGTFRGSFSKVFKLISNFSKWSKYTPLYIEGSLETVQLIWHNRGTFHGIFLKVLKLIQKCSKWSKHTPLWVWGSLELWLSCYDTIWNPRNFWQNSVEFAIWYILTIWNSLETVLRLLKKFRGKFCFSDCAVFCEALLRCSSNSLRIILWPFGTLTVEKKV